MILDFNSVTFFLFRMIITIHSLQCVQGIIQQRNEI
jgi:hypothetical protein